MRLKSFIGTIVTFSIILGLDVMAIAIPSSTQYAVWKELSTSTIMNMGEKFDNTNMADNALACYTIVESRYDRHLTQEEKTVCIEALLKKWGIYYYRFYDYASALDCLLKAQDIAEESHIPMPAINMQLGIFYHNISSQNDDPYAARIAFAHYRKGFADAIATKCSKYIHVLASNMIELAFQIDSLNTITYDIARYRRIYNECDNPKYLYNLHMIDGLRLLQNRRYEESEAILDSLAINIPDDENMLRYKLMAYIIKGRILFAQNDYDRCISALAVPLEYAERDSIKDFQIEIYKTIAESHHRLGHTFEAMQYENKSLKLKDGLVNFSNLSRINDMQTARKIDKIQQHVKEIETQRRMHQIIAGLSGIFVLVISTMLIILYARNRRLNESNRNLYTRNIEILNKSKEESEIRKEYERRLAEIAARPTQSAASDNASLQPKYKKSPLDDTQKITLMNSLLSIMENTTEYLSPSFSVERLAELAGSKQKLVSQVINEKRGCNFNSFVNEFRINEACRRINDTENYGNLTLDAISQSVGFRARSSFVNAFKQITGLTPLHYQKIAKSSK